MNDIYRALNRVGLDALTGQQKYFVQVASDAHHQRLSVVSFEALERIGEPYRITVQLTYEKALARADYLGRDATFTMDAGEGTTPCVYAGCITQFSKTKTTQDFHAYEFVIEAHVAKLRITESCRTFQKNTGPEIIETVLRKHGFERHHFTFKLRRDYVKHEFCFQYQMSDWAYVHMLMQKEGIFCYTEHGEHGDVLVFGDDLDHYVYQPVLKVPYRETSGLQSEAVAVTRLRTDTKLVPQSIAAIDYYPLSAWELHQAQVNAAPRDSTTYGESSHFATGQMDHEGAKREARLRHEAALAQQVIYDGVSNISALRPGRVFRMDQSLPDAPDGQLVIEVRHSGARDKAYQNTYKAIPADRPFRLPLAPHTWPKIAGTLSARVTAPKACEYAYLTDDGRYTVRLSCDAGLWQQGGESVPLRLAKPFAGGAQTGMHFPVLAGTEAVIGFRDGDPDKPYIVAFHHTDLQPDLVNRQDRRYTRNLIETQSGNQQGMEDYRGQEGINLSTEHSGKTQLNLGYLPDAEKKARGETLIDPAGIVREAAEETGDNPDLRYIFSITAREATNFQRSISGKYHGMTYVLYGDGDVILQEEKSDKPDKLLSFGTVTWRGRLPGGTTEKDLQAAHLLKDNHRGELTISIGGQTYVLTVQPPDECGDGTVPVSSAAAQRGKSGVQQTFRQRGFNHQDCFKHPWPRWAALYAIGKIAKIIPERKKFVTK